MLIDRQSLTPNMTQHIDNIGGGMDRQRDNRQQKNSRRSPQQQVQRECSCQICVTA